MTPSVTPNTPKSARHYCGICKNLVDSNWTRHVSRHHRDVRMEWLNSFSKHVSVDDLDKPITLPPYYPEPEKQENGENDDSDEEETKKTEVLEGQPTAPVVQWKELSHIELYKPRKANTAPVQANIEDYEEAIQKIIELIPIVRRPKKTTDSTKKDFLVNDIYRFLAEKLCIRGIPTPTIILNSVAALNGEKWGELNKKNLGWLHKIFMNHFTELTPNEKFITTKNKVDELFKYEIQYSAGLKKEKNTRIEDATEGSPERVWLFSLIMDLTLVVALYRQCYPHDGETRSGAEDRLRILVQQYVEDGGTFVDDIFAIQWVCKDGKRALFERTCYLLFTLTGQRVDTVCRSIQETMAKMMKKKVEKPYQCYSVSSSSEETTIMKNLFTEHSKNGEAVSIDVPDWLQGLFSNVWFDILVPLYKQCSHTFVIRTNNETINKSQKGSNRIFKKYLGCTNYARRRLIVELHDQVFSHLPSKFRDELLWFILADKALEKVAAGKGHSRGVEIECYGGKKKLQNASSILDRAVDHLVMNEERDKNRNMFVGIRLKGSLLRTMVEETLQSQTPSVKTAKTSDIRSQRPCQHDNGEHEDERDEEGEDEVFDDAEEVLTVAEGDAERNNKTRDKNADQQHKYDVCVTNEKTLVRIGRSDHGQGAFATVPIGKGTRIAIYDGLRLMEEDWEREIPWRSDHRTYSIKGAHGFLIVGSIDGDKSGIKIA